MSRDMLVHLLEEIVNRYQMGTLFAPYNREIFIMFQQDKALPEGERRKTLDNWLRLLEKNISQYLTETLILGLSMEFTALPESREQYEKAVLAAEQHFFHEEENLFFYRKITESNVLGFFLRNIFFQRDGWKGLKRS